MSRLNWPTTITAQITRPAQKTVRVLGAALVIALLLVSAFAVNGHTAMAGSEPGSKNADKSSAAVTAPDAPDAAKQIIGYFPAWGAADRNFYVKNLVTSGSAAKMTKLLYAFSNVSNGKCVIGSAADDLNTAYTAANSVSGVADSSAANALRGNFHQLQELKVKYPNLKVVISIGGWSWSSNFSAMAQTATGRQTFVQSCIDMYIKGQFAPGRTFPGIFDGIDVDWEYPGSCGNTCDFTAADPANYVKLLSTFRSQLNALGTANGRTYSLSIASPAGASNYSVMQLANTAYYLDSINLMAYDVHGAWESQTDFNAPLYGPGAIDSSVTAYLNAGVPASKLILGIPFYGRGWTGVTNANNGLYQNATGPAHGTYEDGAEDYRVLKNLTGYTGHRDPQTQAFWVFNGSTFWSYDDPTTIATKMTYAKTKNLGGAMFWDASGDDANGTLISAMYNGLAAAAPTATRTKTAVAATATRTRTATATRTKTAVAGTATRTRTKTAVATATRTKTAVAGTATRTRTKTAVATATRTKTAVAGTATRTRTATATRTRTATPTRTAVSGSNKQVLGYFTEWGVYARNYHVKNLVTSGTAAKMTTLLYAFSNVSNGKCVLGDSYADYDKYYDAAGSVSGVSDTWDSGALRGNFHQLQELKVKYPNLKVVISIGGWSWSSNFSAMAQTAAGRQAFVQSCINLYIKGQFAPGLTVPGIFDGIDVDWEYPGSCGLTCNYSAQDSANFVALLAEFRSQLNTLGTTNGRRYSLHIAAPAGSDHFSVMPLSTMHQYLDTIDLMAYDMHGAWETKTNFDAPLYGSTNDPSGLPAKNYNVDYAVTAYLNAGVPASKLVVGIPFYGRGWTGVTNANHGLYQNATGPATGTYENGVEDYHVLKNLTGYTGYRDSQTQAYWVFNGSTFWSYDDPTAITTKMSYVKTKSLGGAMFWDATGDDSTGSLITAIYNGLH